MIVKITRCKQQPDGARTYDVSFKGLTHGKVLALYNSLNERNAILSQELRAHLEQEMSADPDLSSV